MKKLFDLKSNFDREVVTITITSTLLIMVNNYHNITGIKDIDALGIYLLIPLGIIVFVFRKHPREYGFQFGDWKAGLALTALIILISAPILLLTTSYNSGMQNYYGWQLSWSAPLLKFINLMGWEFFFRGWILFGYARVFGDHALWLQAVPFALAHIGKPEIETLSTIFGGFLFGLVAWRTKSFVYPLLIHWFVYTFTVLVAGGGI